MFVKLNLPQTLRYNQNGSLKIMGLLLISLLGLSSQEMHIKLKLLICETLRTLLRAIHHLTKRLSSLETQRGHNSKYIYTLQYHNVYKVKVFQKTQLLYHFQLLLNLLSSFFKLTIYYRQLLSSLKLKISLFVRVLLTRSREPIHCYILSLHTVHSFPFLAHLRGLFERQYPLRSV